VDGIAVGCILVTGTGGCVTVASSVTPSSHTHGNITNDGKIDNGVSKVVVTDANCRIGVADFVASATTANNASCLGGAIPAYYLCYTNLTAIPTQPPFVILP